jgi:hypothetical protein
MNYNDLRFECIAKKYPEIQRSYALRQLKMYKLSDNSLIVNNKRSN